MNTLKNEFENVTSMQTDNMYHPPMYHPSSDLPQAKVRLKDHCKRDRK